MSTPSMIGMPTYVKISALIATTMASTSALADTAFERIGKESTGSDWERINKRSTADKNLATDIEDGATRVVQVITAGAIAIGFALFVLGIIKFYSAQKNQQPLSIPITAIIVGLFLMIAGVAGFSGASQLKSWLF